MQNILTRIAYFLKDFAPYLIIIFISIFAFVYCAYKISKSQSSQKKKHLLLALSTACFALILVFCGFEAYFRYVYDEPDGLGFLQVNKKWHERHVVYNGAFFRDRNFEDHKKPGVIRIGVLGDSITFGAGIENVSDRYTNLLEKKLTEAGYKVEVFNLGLPGYDIDNQIAVYDKMKYLDFDIVVWAFFINDIQPKVSTGTPIINKSNDSAKALKFVFEKSFLADYLYWRFSNVYNKTISDLRHADVEQYKNTDRVKTFNRQSTDFISSLKKDNKKVVIVMFPSVALIGNDYPEFINDMMLKLYAKNNVPVANLYTKLKDKNSKDLRASRFDTHPNEKVHEIAAELLFAKIKPLIK